MKNRIHIFSTLLFVFYFFSCQHDHQHETEDHAHVEVGHHEEESNFTSLTSAQMESIHIELGQLERKQLTSSLKANGFLKVPNQNRASINASMGGTIKSILVQEGTSVRQGQSIVTISNPSIISMQEEYLSVSAKTELTETEVVRQKTLSEGNATALKNYQQAEAELKSLKAKRSSLRKQLSLIGIKAENLTADNMRELISIPSPISGVVSEIKVNIGSYVEPNHSIAEIVDNNQLHLDLFVYEKDLSKLKVGQTIHFTLTNVPGKEYDADVYAISNSFEPSTKAIAVHAKVKGNKQGLMDGMSITALISLEDATVNAVPETAIVNHNGQDFIFIVSDEENHHAENEKEEHVTFERLPVVKGTTDVGYAEITILKPIPPTTKIVTNGAFFILAKMTNHGESHEH